VVVVKLAHERFAIIAIVADQNRIVHLRGLIVNRNIVELKLFK